MKKFFVTSDVHSFFDELVVALNEKGFDKNNKDHILCICGDLFDRGPKSRDLFEFVKELQTQDRLIYITGNHESLLFDCMSEIYNGRIPGRHHFSNGTISTICQFCDQNEWIIYDPTWRDKIFEIMQPVLDFISDNCVDYAEIGDYVLVHGYLPCYQGLNDFRNGTDDDWERARWNNGIEMWRNPNNRIDGKTIIVGHWNCSYGWSHIDQKYKEFPSPSHRQYNPVYLR